MKTIILSFVIVAVCFSAKAGKNSYHYIFTDNDTLFCKNVRIGYVKTKCVLLSGEKKVLSNEEINIVCKISNKGKTVYILEKKPVFLNNQFTGSYALMELVDVHSNIRIFKYEYFNNQNESMDAIFSYYNRHWLLNTQTNPSLAELYEIIDNKTLDIEKPLLTTLE